MKEPGQNKGTSLKKLDNLSFYIKHKGQNIERKERKYGCVEQNT